jgi:hypothetical protein
MAHAPYQNAIQKNSGTHMTIFMVPQIPGLASITEIISTEDVLYYNVKLSTE